MFKTVWGSKILKICYNLQSITKNMKQLLKFTQNHIDPLFRTVSWGSWGPSRDSPGPLGSFLRKFIEFLRN